jgi:hypothetical protein
LATLKIAVKKQLPEILDLYPVIEPTENLIPTVPASIDVQSSLQATFGKHANMAFTVNSLPSISVAYDLNGDGMLAYTGQNFASNQEALTINNYLYSNGANLSINMQHM